MAAILTSNFFYRLVFVLTVVISIVFGAAGTDEDLKDYIVYMGSLPEEDYSPKSHHLSLLGEVVQDSTSAADYLITSYHRSFNGFAAKLTDREAQKLARKEGVVSVFRDRNLQIHTTRSWDFVSLVEKVSRNPTVESDTIVGVIDTGIWPESESFNDEGFGPPPKKWKGSCEGGFNFTCNNKIIGAWYSKDLGDNSARDKIGHGTHTASTAAGGKVADMSFYGLAKGAGRGGVPSARIAVYKVCSDVGCPMKDILSAFDQAIADQVDIITVSLGGLYPLDLDNDAISIGAFHAMVKGILTVHSVGNDGPAFFTAVGVAPWELSVAASSIDREFIDKVVLGNGSIFIGKSVNPFKLNRTEFDLLDGTQGCCMGCEFCLNSTLAKGKIVVGDNDVGARDILSESFNVGAVGAIFPIENEDVATVVPFSATALLAHDYSSILSYAKYTKHPRATILRSQTVEDKGAPKVASFSSRGPNSIVPEILKPDISGPGINILAAFSPVSSPSSANYDTRSAKYSILSGTSMSCPHVAGAAAYVKTFHLNWSPSAIKSALMTTASPMDGQNYEYGEFDYGAGHLNPVKAVHPGLVYEAFKYDYVAMLCSMGYNESKIKLIAGPKVNCPSKTKLSPKDLNYPSMAVNVEDGKPFNVEFKRTVTNVGIANSTYESKITTLGSNVNVTVKPSVLSFKALYEKKSFVLTVTGRALSVSKRNSAATASLLWSDKNNHIVRSPIVVYTDRF